MGKRRLKSGQEEAEAELGGAKERLGEVRETVAELQGSVAEARAAAKAVEKEQSAIVKQAEKAEAVMAVARASSTAGPEL